MALIRTDSANSRSHAQVSAALSDELYQQLAERIPHIVFTSSPTGEVDYFNQRWFDYTGASRPFDPMGWVAYVHPEDMGALMNRMKERKRPNVDYELEYRIRRHDGAYRWHMVRSVPIFDAHGDVVRWFGTNTDIHDRKELEDNHTFLSEAHKVLASSLDYKKTLNLIANLAVPRIADWCVVELVDSAGILRPVALAHRDPEKVAWARQFRRKYPATLDETEGIAHVMRTGRPMLVPHLTDDMLAAASKSSEYLEGLRSLGFSSVMIVPLSSGKSSIGCITFISSENKRQYDDADLAIAVEIASRASLALQNAGLYQSAKEAIVLRDNFISMASHELKTPVTSLRIFTEVLQKRSQQAGDEVTFSHLTKMDRQLAKLTDLIFNMLDISKMNDEHLELNRAVFNFDRMVQEVVESLQYGTPSHTIHVENKTGATVYGDEDRVAQVLVNLISNAVKYSPRADRIVVTLGREDDRVICSVQDFGIGIDSAHLKRVFERFYRISDGIHRTYPGLGIGLFLSAEIVERHGGKIWAESEKGKGSTFYFSVPIAT